MKRLTEAIVARGERRLERRAEVRADLAAIWTEDQRQANRVMNLAKRVREADGVIAFLREQVARLEAQNRPGDPGQEK